MRPMNRKVFAAMARENGWTGDESNDSAESVKAFFKSKGVGDFMIGGQTVTMDEVDDIWKKKVTISYDPTDDVEVNQNEQTESAEEDEDPMVDPEAKSLRDASAKRAAEKHARSQDLIKKVNSISVHSTKTGYNSQLTRTKAAYDMAVRNGEKFMGKQCVFGSADEQEMFGAAARLSITKGGFHHYKHVANDMAMIGKTAGSTSDNAWAGTLVISEVAPNIINLLHQHGAARQLAGTTPMKDGVQSVKRRSADMAFSYVTEGGAIAETNPTYNQVELIARKTAGIARLNNELLDDSAFDLGGEIADSTRAGANLFEDQEYFFGTHGTHGGLAGAIDSSSTYDAALATNWEDYTVPKLQAWLGKVNPEAWTSGTVQIACSSAFYFSVLRRWAMSAGGNTGDKILNGIGGGYSWDGIPVILTEVLPSTYSADQTVAYIGSFKRGTKMGEVKGSAQLTSSGEAFWTTSQFAWKFEERLAFNFHDVGGTSSEVIALKD